MNEKELINFLKENLKINIEKEIGWYGSQFITIKLVLTNNNEEIVINSANFGCHV